MKDSDLIVLNYAPLPDAMPTDGWHMLAPFGEFPGKTKTGREIVQVIDQAAADALVKNFSEAVNKNPSVGLIDREHFSETVGDTTAYGWIRELQKRADGVWMRVDWTDIGEPAVRNKRFRFISPVFLLADLGNGKARPVYLEGAGLTNRHNLKSSRPLFNKDGAPAAQGENNMNEIATLLGLAPDADPQAVLDALKAKIAELDSVKQQLAEATKTVEAAKTEALNKEAEAFIVANKTRIQHAEVIKKLYVQNKDAVLAMFNALPPGAASVMNTAAAQTPAPLAPVEPDKRSRSRTILCAKIMNREKCNFKTAWSIAREEKPELFKSIDN